LSVPPSALTIPLDSRFHGNDVQQFCRTAVGCHDF